MLPKYYDFKRIEEKWREKWKDINIKFDPKSKKPVFVIDTPPPYPTGSIHLGHILDYGLTDIIARTRRMLGFNVYYPQGYDCHGLPIEVKVEEKYKISGAEAYRNPKIRKKFIDLCHQWIFSQIESTKHQFDLIGCSADPDLEYITDTKEYIKKVQLSFLRLFEKGEIYKGKHPVIWCPRCHTAIAEAEVEYREQKTKLSYIIFKTKEGKDVPIATTRPEFLPACVAVCVHPEDERNNWLIGKVLQVPPNLEREVKVIGDRAVDPNYGTGVLMVCSFGDKEDIKNIKKYNLEVIKLINEDGRITKGKYKGLSIKKAREEILKDLRQKGLLVKQEKITHRIGLCWRCDTPVEYIITEQWFLKALEHKKELLEIGKQINWYPKFLYQRYADWVNSLLWDWVISRQRVFATPIPLWYCKNGHVILPNEKDLPVNPPIDEPPVKCPQCGSKEIIPEKDVLDTWFDSSLTALFISGWPELKKKLFPNSLRRQGIDIIRTWAFYTILRTYLLERKIPWRDAMMHGMVLGPDGMKMSKSRGNVVLPAEVLKEYGVDTLRQWIALAPLGENYSIDPKELKHSQRFLNKYWNLARFASALEFEMKKPKLEIFDLWILTKLRSLLQEVRKNANDYNTNAMLRKIRNFVWHTLADHYVELIKYRKKSKAAKYTLYTTLNTINKLLAPIIPFITEEIYSNLFKKFEGKESVHLLEWPRIEEIPFDIKAEEIGDLGIKILSTLREYKTKHQMAMSQELSNVVIYTKRLKDLEKVRTDLKETMHIKDLEIKREEGKGIEITPDIKVSIA